MKYLFFILLTAMLSFHGTAQTLCTKESKARLENTLKKLPEFDLSKKPIGEITIEVGQWFLHTPYVAKTLEVPGDEPLVIDYAGLDCTTFLESMVTLSRLAKLGRCEFEDYEEQLEYLRYRDGIRDHYPSRLHYFTDWIYNNAQKGILKNITAEIGGEPYENTPDFMSSHPQYYSQLENGEYVSLIAEAESAISERAYHFIPKEKLRQHEKGIQNGDLIAITTSIEGLDIAHVGIAIEKNGRIHMLHASTGSNQVEVSEKPLAVYLMGNEKQSGVMICRLIEPR